jgi:hypothetical protein
MAPSPRPATSPKPPTKPAKKWRPFGFLDRIGATEMIVFALTVGIGVWSWLAYVVHTPQDFPTFTVIFLGVTLLGSAVQMVFFLFVRPSGSLRARVTLESLGSSRSGTSVVFWAPTVIYGVVFLIVTPPGTSGAGFDPDMNIYQFIALIVALSLIATAFGSVLLYCFVILPLVLLLHGILPEAPDSSSQSASAMSRTEYVCLALIILSAVTFGISMAFIAPGATSASSFGRMGQQFLALVSLQGLPVPSIIVIGCVAALIVLGIISNRAARKRRRASAARLFTSATR